MSRGTPTAIPAMTHRRLKPTCPAKNCFLSRKEVNGQDEAEGDEIFYDDDEEDPEDEAYEVDDDGDADDAVEALAQDMDLADDPELVDAFATILQRKKGQKLHGKGSGSKGQSQSFPLQAKGEVTVDQRTRAIKFLKSVTPCTSVA